MVTKAGKGRLEHLICVDCGLRLEDSLHQSRSAWVKSHLPTVLLMSLFGLTAITLMAVRDQAGADLMGTTPTSLRNRTIDEPGNLRWIIIPSIQR